MTFEYSNKGLGIELLYTDADGIGYDFRKELMLFLKHHTNFKVISHEDLHMFWENNFKIVMDISEEDIKKFSEKLEEKEKVKDTPIFTVSNVSNFVWGIICEFFD